METETLTHTKMRRDWDRRAKEGFTFVAPSTSLEEFKESGRSDATKLLSGMAGMPLQSMRVLDIGCGLGRMDEYLAGIFREVHGIDVSLEMVQRAKKSLDMAGCGNAFFYLGSGYELGQFRNESFELVLSYITFQHVPRRVFRAYLPEIWRVLGDGGLLRFQMLSLRIPRWLYVWIRRVKNLKPRISSEPSDEDTWSMRFYDRAELESTLTAFGFRNTRITSESLSPISVANLLWVTTQKTTRGEKLSNQ